MPPTYPDLRDKHVLITGGAGGIGDALTRAFAQQGSRISVLDKDAAAGRRLADELGDAAGNVRFYEVELTDEAQTVEVLRRVQDDLGVVDVLINNAGWDPRYDLTAMTAAQWDSLFKLNVGHYFLTCRELLPAMIERAQQRPPQEASASIIMTASCEFWVGHGRLACYTATKGAIMGFVKALAREVGPHGIRVNAVAPGWVMTERQLREMVTPQVKQKLLEEWQVLPFYLTPQLLAPTYLFLASEASRPITRQTILVDAGIAQA